MTTPDSFGSGGVTGAAAGGLAAGPGDDGGESAVTREAQTGRASRPDSAADRPAEDSAASAGTEGGLGRGGETGPELTEDDEETAAD